MPGGTANVRVPQPSDITGPFQNIAKQPDFGLSAEMATTPRYYRDVAVQGTQDYELF